MTTVIDGKAFANNLCESLKSEVATLAADHDLRPCIAVVLVGEDPASQVYVRNKIARCHEVGIVSKEYRLSDTTSQEELLTLLDELNRATDVHGILVQLPVPRQISENAVIDAIAPSKDVDGFHVHNAGALSIGANEMVPCTPLGSIMMLQNLLGDLSGLHAVVVGRSNIVGKPMALLLLQQNCTVTIAHSRTKNIKEVCRQADILVAAVGRPRMIEADWVKEGVVVIDVGINRIEEDGRKRLVGDVDYAGVAPLAAAITPVPGGVGPMTIACLLHNTVTAAKRQNDIAC